MRARWTLGVVAALGILVGCQERVTTQNFEKIAAGMTMDQVEHILGKGKRQDVGGVSISGSGIAGQASGPGDQPTYVWESNGKEIAITFKDKKVISKSKSGL